MRCGVAFGVTVWKRGQWGDVGQRGDEPVTVPSPVLSLRAGQDRPHLEGRLEDKRGVCDLGISPKARCRVGGVSLKA